MAMYHINPVTSNAGKCSATEKCPFGGDDAHFTTADAARAAFESGQNPFPEQKPLKSLTFGGETWENVTLEGARYGSNGELAILSYVDEGYGPEPLADVSVNLEGLGISPREGAFFIKDWSEGEGLAAALKKAGVVTLTGRKESVNQWGSEAIEAELTPKYSYLAAEANWAKVTDDSPSIEEPTDFVPAAETAVDVTAAYAAQGHDYSVSFKNHRGTEPTARVISQGDVFDIAPDGRFIQTQDPKADEPRRPAVPSEAMRDSLLDITASLISKKTDFGVGFSKEPFGSAAERATIITKDHYFTIRPDGRFEQTNR